MFLFITGGASSGKSEIAETIARQLGDQKLYLATMKPVDQETVKRIQRHRQMRREKNFDTIEIYGELTGISAQKKYDCILLECMSNVLANLMFSKKKIEVFSSVKEGISHLFHFTEHLVVVSNELFSDGASYQDEMKRYLNSLGEINQWMANQADIVIEAVCGIPVMRKGEL